MRTSSLGHALRALLAAAALLALGACATHPALEESRRLLAEGRAEEALARLEAGMVERPDDAEVRVAYFRQREIYLGQLLAGSDSAAAAGRIDEALAGYARVLALDAQNARALAGQERVRAGERHRGQLAEAQTLFKKGELAGAESRVRSVLAENPGHAEARALLRRLDEKKAAEESAAQVLKSPFGKSITLEFREASLRSVFEVISRSAGINFVFDKDVRADTKVTLFMRNTTIDDVVKLILTTNQLERKLLNDNSVLIYPNTPVKNRDYQEMVVRSFYLANTEAKQAQVLVKAMVKSRDVFIDEKLNLLVVRDTPEAVRLVERLLGSLDVAEPEVMLDVEVLEVSRTRLTELGLRFPDQISYGLLQPTTTNTIITTTGTQTSTNLGGQLAQGFINTRELNASVPFIANPALILNLKDQDGDANLLANPRIRVKSKEKAKVHIGEKLPVFTTTSTANVGVSASVTYLDVGLKLEVEPTVHLDDEVAIKVGMEVSSIVKEVPGPSSSLAYQVGTRSAATVLRLRNGETQVLAGLINDEERNSASRLPGLGEIPVLGRLFSTNKATNTKTEIVLLITPRILRNIARPDAASLSVAAGTDAAVGSAPLSVRPTAAGALGIAPQNAGAASPPGIPRPGQPEPATAEAPQPPSAPVPQLSLAAPPQASLGSEFVVTASLALGSELGSAQIDVAFDPAALELVGAAASGGRATLPLVPDGAGVRADLRFKVLRASGAALVQVTALRASDPAGIAVPVNLPPPRSIVLAP